MTVIIFERTNVNQEQKGSNKRIHNIYIESTIFGKYKILHFRYVFIVCFFFGKAKTKSSSRFVANDYCM